MHRCVPLHIRVTQSDVTIPVVFHLFIVLHGRRILGAQRSPWRIRTLVFGLKQLIASAENSPYKAVDTQCHQRELRMIAVQAPPITIVFALRPLCD